jgi:hypothetical protein
MKKLFRAKLEEKNLTVLDLKEMTGGSCTNIKDAISMFNMLNIPLLRHTCEILDIDLIKIIQETNNN